MAVVDRWRLLPPERQRGKRWQVRWRDDEGRQRKRSFEKKAQAERWELQVRSALATGSYVDDRNQTTVAEAVLAWLEIRPHRPSTRRRMLGLVTTHIVDVPLGSRRLAAVRPSEVQAWATDRSKHLSPLVLRQLVSTLRSVYTGAVLDRLVGSNPVGRVALPRHETARVVPLTSAQVHALADAMPARMHAMVITQAGLGLRIGELLGLRVQDVDFLRRLVRIESQVNDRGQRAELKTPASKRTLPLAPIVADELARHIAAHPPGRDGLLFATSAGTPFRNAEYNTRGIKVAAARAGLPASTSSHDLRHFYASMLLDAGEGVVTVAARLGHADATMVLRVYGHLMTDREERTRNAVDAGLALVKAQGQ